jgi:hypothetical protein
MHHVPRRDGAGGDRDAELLEARLLHDLQRGLDDPLGELDALLPEGLGDGGAALGLLLLALLGVDDAADARARLAGDDEAFPLRVRRAAARGDDLDLVAILERRAQRLDLAVDLRADALVADLAVHLVGEVHRRRAARQRDEVAARREAEDLVAVQLSRVASRNSCGSAACSRISSRSFTQGKRCRSRAASPPCL